MKKIGFIGVYDKTDLLLCIAKVLRGNGKKVLIIDATTTQKGRYIVPAVKPTKSYITEFEKIDVAVGFESSLDMRRYLGLEDREPLGYDVVLIDSDNYDGVMNFQLLSSEKIYYTTSFDAYSLKKGIELLGQLSIPNKVTRIFYSKDMLKEEEEYFDYLTLELKVSWTEQKVYFLLENGDQAALIENQRLEKIRFKDLSTEFKDNIVFLVRDIDSSISEKDIRNLIKNL